MQLDRFVQDNTIGNTLEVQESMRNMICPLDAPIPLNEGTLLSALKLQGEFFILKLHYDDLLQELQDEKIKYKISQALSVIVSYEDDTHNFNKINSFVEYIHSISDNKQNSTFGVKKVKVLSEFPITILFSGILPINQLKMSFGSKIHEFINADKKYYAERFARHRDEISQEIGISILPILPQLSKTIDPYEVLLVDLMDGRTISKFEVTQNLSRENVERYLLKLFYVFKVLAEEKCYNNSQANKS